jgi:hypothetical protein
MLHDPNYLILRDEKGESIPLQTRILDRWPDGSIRWLLLDWQATVSGDTKYRLEVSDSLQEVAPVVGGIRIKEAEGEVTVDTGPAEFRFKVGAYLEWTPDSISLRGMNLTSEFRAFFAVKDKRWRSYQPLITKLTLVNTGSVRSCIAVQGELKRRRHWGYFETLLHFFADSPSLRFFTTIGNYRKAIHQGGFWELGKRSSLFIKWASFGIYLPSVHKQTRVICSAAPGEPYKESVGGIEVWQGSSGGPNWHPFCGYQISLASEEKHEGRRAVPIITVERGELQFTLAMRYFWQNFPKRIWGAFDTIWNVIHPAFTNLGLELLDDCVELQGGEQKTHEFVVAFGKDEVTPEQPLEWVRSPLRVRVDPAWYAVSGVVPYLTPEAEDPNADYIKLVRAAIEGEDTFEKKRDVVDEYGWRNFGDIYADHEAVAIEKASGVSDDPGTGRPKTGALPRPGHPLVSHYNNQYDPLAGFAYQFMRSGDWRWWEAMNELAAHVVDIDIYHTDQDKAAYNHGLFWHTVHYTDAGLSTHRSYPRPGDGTRSVPATSGGGPGNEHNYTTGLMLHYFLTGNPQSREAAIGLAQWVIDMEDGTKTIFRWLDRGYTGLASATVSPLYHGPGRGAGNSINALLDGHRLTGERRFLDKAEQLIRRCIHPADDIGARNLLDAERRWSYTVFLQALGKYLDYKSERDELDWMHAYGRAALLHYARWMAEHEYPYLQKPEILEYPTETWVAQDMRKSEVFKFAAKHAGGEERKRFLERSEFFFRYVTTTLIGMKTRTLARPVVILLSNGFMHAYFQKHLDEAAPLPRENPSDFGKPEVFMPQKVRAKRRLLILTAVLATIGLLAFLWRMLGA